MPRLEINNFLGIQTSTTVPNINSASQLINFDTRKIEGGLELRNGSHLLYNKPEDTASAKGYLSNINYLFMNNIYTGHNIEITLIVGQATLSAVESITPSNISVPVVFASHKWNGSSWDLGWDCLTESYITQIATIGISADKHQITFDGSIMAYVGSATYAAENNRLAGYTVYNYTKNEYALIVKSSYSIPLILNNIYISNNTHSWAKNDVLIIMKNFIPFEYFSLSDTLSSDDISSHFVNNDIIISFGGEANRLALMVGFRDDYLNILSCDFGSFTHSELVNATRNNGLILAPYYPEGIDLVPTLSQTSTNQATTAVSAGVYSIKAVPVINGYNMYALNNESNISCPGSTPTESFIIISEIKLRAGTENKFLTDISSYIKTPNNYEHSWYNDYSIRNSQNQYNLELNEDGYYVILNGAQLHTNTEDATGRAITGDLLSIGNWETSGATITAEAGTGGGSENVLKIAMSSDPAYIYIPVTADINKWYDVSFYIKSDDITDNIKCTPYFMDDGLGLLSTTIGTGYIYPLYADGYKKYTFRIKLDTSPIGAYYFGIKFDTGTVTLYLDRLTISESNIIEDTTLSGDTISDDLGYSPNGVYAKSWDYSINNNNVYILNPYFEKRYTNLIVTAPISSSGVVMNNVISPDKYVDLNGFDGNDIVGITPLSNTNLLILKEYNILVLDTNNQTIKSMDFVPGCISRRSIVNLGDRVIWCSESGIYITNGIETKDITEDTIKEEYKLISDKTKIIATADIENKAYKFYNGVDTEYVFTKRGWIKEVKQNIFPDYYAVTKNGKIIWMDDGKCYDDYEYYYDDANSYVFNLISQEINGKTLGLTEPDIKIFVKSLFCNIYLNNYTSPIYLDLYYNYSSTPDVSISVPSNSGLFSKRVPIYRSVKSFRFGIHGTPSNTENKAILKSIGVEYILTKYGRWIHD